MANLEDQNNILPQSEGDEPFEDDLPASPEEVGVARTPSIDVNEPSESVENPDQGEIEPHDAPEEPENVAPPGDDELHSQAEADDQETDDPIEEPDSPEPSKGKGRPRFNWLIASLLGLLILLVIAAISAFGGYQSGITVRQQAESTQLAGAVQQQYELGVQDLEAGNYYRARQRLEYVINLNPDYPGAAEKLAAVLYELNTTATPTLVPTPTLTPTPDTRGEQELFDQGQEYLRNSEWDNAIETLLTLRKASPDFFAVQVDGMLFVALRNRGKDKILLEQDLEGGIYDLTLAERFGVLDAEADGLLSWTRLYITGASFWEIDWGQAAYYFGQVAPHLPNLMDKSGYTAGERYRIALIEYGYYLAEQKQWCKSYEQFQIALSLAYDAQTEQDMNTTADRCAKQDKNE
jgi:tetratricopeptide (TPR) repeat protein